jgi:hypothetical protein
MSLFFDTKRQNNILVFINKVVFLQKNLQAR